MTESTPQPDTGLQCPKCGYNLTAVTSSTCPECGERFVITNVHGYLAKHPPSKIRQVCYGAWVASVILIVMSWFNIVPNAVGWIGFGIGMAAWLVSSQLKR